MRYLRPQRATQNINPSAPVHNLRRFGTAGISLYRVSMAIGLLISTLCNSSRAQVLRDYTYNPNHYDAIKIIQAMRSPHSDLVMISAHRGLHSTPGDDPNVPGLPENSLAAVGGAAQAGLELFELDIKQTPDGQLTFSHDKTWGRQTVPADGSRSFDPFSDPTQQKSLNLPLATTPLTTLQANWRLRDSVTLLFPSNPEPPPTLQQVISFYNQHQIGAVLALDVKDVDTFKKAWAVVSQAKDFLNRPFWNDVIWKVSGNNYKTPAAFKADFADSYQNINYWPVYNTSDIAPSSQAATIPPPDGPVATNGNGFGSEQAIIDSLNSFYADSSIRIISAEITQKQPNGILSATRQNALNSGRSAAEFSATGDYFRPGDPTPRFFSSQDGTCCQTLDQFYYNGAPNGQPSDTSDDRGDFNFVVLQGFNIITADTAVRWKDQLFSLGLRNLIYMQEDAATRDPHCNVGPGQYPGCDANGQTSYTYCSGEGSGCGFYGDRNVAFGANGVYTSKTRTNFSYCDTLTFGDPLPNVPKACYYGPAIDPTAQFQNGLTVYCGNEGDHCSFSGLADAFYAANGQGTHVPYDAAPRDGFGCTTSTFPSDPAPGFYKACFYMLHQPYFFVHTGPDGYGYCSPENGSCQFKGVQRVAYGAYPRFTYQVAKDGVACTNSVFGDPSPYYTKDCWVEASFPVNSASTGTQGPGPGGTGGSTPTLSAANSDTFTVTAGATRFTVSQPNDSVATYTWTNGGSPSEVLTSASGASLGYALTAVPVTTYSGAAVSDNITVDPNTTYQTIDGFGGAMTDSAASLILGSSNSNQILQTLFGRGPGQAGLTFVRSPMGSSDMMASPTDIHTYSDIKGNFSVTNYASDQRQITALQQAKAIVGSDFKLLGTPWSAPGWAKNDGSLLPFGCGTQQNEISLSQISDYTNYFVSYVNAYTAAGLQPWAVSMQNEPENCKTAMPTTQMSDNDEAILAASLKSRFPTGTKVLGWDHNWNDPDFVNTLVASGSVDSIGYHCYDGTHYSTQTTSLPTYVTECSGFIGSSENVAANLGWEVANVIMGPMRYGSHGSIYWSLAQDPNGNPHLGGSDACQDCRGMITVNADGSFQRSQDFYYWAQFSRFVPPGSVRIASNNSGNISTVAFMNGNQITLVALNSASSHADGGVAGSDERNLRGHIVQWNGDNLPQKTSWLVGSDGHRRWISDGGVYNCLYYDAHMQGPDLEASGALDKYINLENVWAVCGAVTMGTNSELEVGTYLKSTNGARLTLTSTGLKSVDASGTSRWAPAGVGNRLILQEDGNLVLYAGTNYVGTNAVWASNTAGSGAIWLSMRDDGSFALFNSQNKEVWHSQIDASSYKGKMVQWDGDTNTQKATWMVGYDGYRRYVNDLPTFQCLHDAGAGNSLSVSSDTLNLLPNLNNVWATCGGAQIGAGGSLESGSHLTAGSYQLILQTDGNLVEYDGSHNAVWATNTVGSGAVELYLGLDGNLVLKDKTGGNKWASNNYGSNPGWFILGSDGTLRLFDVSGNRIWSRTASEVPQSPYAGGNFCAIENSTCNFTGTAAVLFGTSSGSTSQKFTNGIFCSVGVFGDPSPGNVKACWYQLQ